MAFIVMLMRFDLNIVVFTTIST